MAYRIQEIAAFSSYRSYRLAKRVAIALIGGTITLIGVALVVLPGPAFLVLPLGLGILGVEFVWARRLLQRIKERLRTRDRR